MSEQAAAIAVEQDDSLLAWRIHMLRSHPDRAAILLCVSAFSVAVGWLLFRSPIFCLAALFMLVSATSEYLLPISYAITETDVTARYGANRFRIEWSAVRRALLYSDGIRLSPLAVGGRLDAFRGVYLRFAADGQPGDRESVLELVNRLRPAKPEKES